LKRYRNEPEYRESNPVARAEKHEKKKHKSRLTRGQKWLVAICIVLAVILALVLIYKAVFVRPELPAAPDASTSAEVVGDGTAPKVSGLRKSDDFYTILLLGRDTGGGGNCDTMMLCSYDVTNQKVNVMSIPRDTMVNVPWDVKKINSVYNYYGGDTKGIAALDNEISDLLGFVPDYSVIVEWEAVGKLVDAIGGVYFDVPRDMNYDDPYQDLSIHVDKGYQLLDGEAAMGVIRWRHNNNMKSGYADGDLGRIGTQQEFLKAVIKQLLQVKNVTKIQKFAEIFEQNVDTDLSVQNLFWFGKSAIMGGLDMANVNFVTMPNTPVSCWSRTYQNYQSYVVPNKNEMLTLVNESLSPFLQKVTLSELDLMSVNSDGSVSSTTGHVADSKAATAPSIPSKTDTTPVDNEGTGEVDPNGETTGETGTEGGTGTTGETGTGGDAAGGTGTEGTETGGGQGDAAVVDPNAGGSTTDPVVTDPAGGEIDTGEGYGEVITEPVAPTETEITNAIPPAAE
jgi:LCP family protein required for cell wall assembly